MTDKDITMAEDELSAGIEVGAPTESRAELAMRARIAARLDLDIGQAVQKVGRYEIVRRLGAGGMGVVYEARDPELDRTIAIKILRPGRFAAEVDGHERLRSEARALAKLSHPNVVQIHEVGEHQGGTYVAMELVRGQTLYDWQRLTTRSRTEILVAYRQAGQGLAAAHEAGIIHRDFKPSNVLMGDDGRVRVLDFGLARTPQGQLDESQRDTIEGTPPTGLAGTPGYIAPELLRGRAASMHSDQFSFCVALWEAISGERPSASSRRVGPRWLRKVLLRGLAEEPSERWADMPALLEALDRRPWWRAWLAVGLPVVGIGIGVWGSAMLGESRGACDEVSREFDELWNADSAVRLRGQLLTLGRTDAEIELVLRTLDRQRASWIAAETEVCEQTHVEASWSAQVAEAATRCLADTLEQSRELIELFDPASGDPPVSVREVLARLDDPSECAEIELLSRRPQGAASSAVTSLRQSIARTRLLIAGETRRGDGESTLLLEQARELWRTQPEDLPTQWALAEALELRAEAEQWQQRPDLAWPLLREAVPLARRVGDVALELRCLHRMGYLAAEQLGEPERAADLLALASGVLDEVRPRGRADFDHALARAAVARTEGRFGDAQSLLRAAIDAVGDDGSFDVPTRTRARLRLANVIAEDGKLDEALAIYEGLLATMREQFGEGSVELGFVEFNIGRTLYELGSMDDAERHLRAAQSVLERAVGADYVGLEPTLTTLAELELNSGRSNDALRDAQRAWQLQQRLPPKHGDRGQALKIIAHVHTISGRYLEALATYELMAQVLWLPDDDEVAGIELSIGWSKCRLGRCSEARPHHERVLGLTNDLQLRTWATVGLANVDLVNDEPERALARLDSVRAALDGGLAEDNTLQAEADWLTAWALVDVGGDLARARVHYERAIAGFADRYMPPELVENLERIEEVLHEDE